MIPTSFVKLEQPTLLATHGIFLSRLVVGRAKTQYVSSSKYYFCTHCLQILDLLLVLLATLIARESLLDDIVQRFPSSVPTLFSIWTRVKHAEDPFTLASTSSPLATFRALGYTKKDYATVSLSMVLVD